jgi:spermidine/putrescine transport system substrate-binding protein
MSLELPKLLPLSRRSAMKTGLAAAAAAAGLFPVRTYAAATVTFLGWQGYDDPLVFDGWTTSKEITLNTTYIGNNDEIVTKLRSGGLGTIDLVTPYMGYIPLMVKLGILQPVDRARVPNLEKVIPLFLNDSNLNPGGVLHAVPFTWGSGPMMYDPAAVPTPPESWKDLLKPEFTGKVVMMDDPLGNMMLAALVATDAKSPTQLTSAQLEAAIDFLIAIKKQSRAVTVSWGDMADALSRGDAVISFSGWETIQKFCADKGKKINYHFPKEGTFAWLDSYCIAKDAPNLDVAYEICNHVIDVAPQKRLAENAIQAIVNSDAVAALDPAIKALYPYDSIEDFGKKAGFYSFPPTEPDGTLTTFQEWMKSYERFKSA